MRAFWNAQDHMDQLSKATLVPRVVFAVGMSTSGAALTDVSDLKAAPEVAKANSF